MASKHPGEGLLSREEWTAIGRQFGLTRRELGVAMLMFEGKTRYQIARRLHCAPGTVRVYIDRLFAKLEVKDRLGMALRVVSTVMQSSRPHTSHKSATSCGASS